ncbi:MAG TPA: hypothetical protein PLW44_05080 [Chitinophagales bacterium]|nr:hypothetical protein [Chitinophagales bacterium]
MRFIRFIALWLILCVLAAAVLEYAYRNYQTQAYQLFNKYYRKATTVQKLYIGNSHVGVFGALYPEQAAEVGNMSLGGQDIYRMYTVIKTVVPKSPNLKRIYMGLDYDLLGYNQTKNGEEYLDRAYFPYTGEMYNDNFTNRLMSKSNFFRANRDMAYLFSRNKAPKEINFIPVATVPTPKDTAVKITTTDSGITPAATTLPAAAHKKMDPFMCSKRAKEHTLLKYKEKYIAENLRYLLSIIEICKKHGVELVFFCPPKTTCYMAGSDKTNIENAKHTIDSFTVANHATYLDFYGSPLFNDDMFVDFDHLNPAGTAILNDTLTAFK